MEQEKEAVFKYLSNSIREGRVPDWTAVKYYVKNQIDKRNRVLLAKSTNV